MEPEFRVKQLEKKVFYIQEYKEYISETKVAGFWTTKWIPEKKTDWIYLDSIPYKSLDKALEAISEIGKYPIIHEVK